ncbi:integrase, catalytic region, zinc finger, CCHC-type containing protein [Tanacetum coccineum]
MDRNNVRLIPVAINTKFLNCLQPEWRKYVTMVRHNQTGSAVSYDVLYDSLVQFEPHSNTRFKIGGSGHGRVDIQTKNAGYGGNVNKNAGRNRTQGFNTGNAGHYVRECQKPKVHDEKYFREQMLLAMNDEAGSNLSNEENDFMLDTSYGDDLEELTATSVGSSNSVRRPKSKDNQSSKTINAVVNDGLNILCISYGLDVFLHSREKCVARNALTRKSSVKRALFTSPVTAKSKGLGATSVVAKSRFSVAKTPTATNKVIHLVLWIVDSGCSNYMTGNLQLLRNFIEKFMGTIRFRNDHFAAITGYGDYVQGNLTICHVYYVEGLGHNLFSVGQFCVGDLEVSFQSNTCYVRNLEGDDLLIACEHGKSKNASLPPKLVPSTESKIELLQMDLCRPMRVASINVQRNLKASILTIRTDNGTEFKNEKLRAFYAKLCIVHKTSIARTPQQNGVVERRNRTLVEAARTMLIFSKAP